MATYKATCWSSSSLFPIQIIAWIYKQCLITAGNNQLNQRPARQVDERKQDIISGSTCYSLFSLSPNPYLMEIFYSGWGHVKCRQQCAGAIAARKQRKFPIQNNPRKTSVSRERVKLESCMGRCSFVSFSFSAGIPVNTSSLDNVNKRPKEF